MATWPQVQAGAQGLQVQTVQDLLDAHGATLDSDGDFGALTTAAVEKFQSNHGLAADGIVGDLTWPALIVEIREGSTGDAVKALQLQIDSQISVLGIDGIFGSDTDSAVRTFQGDTGLTVDGIVGPITWNALVERTAGAGQGQGQANENRGNAR